LEALKISQFMINTIKLYNFVAECIEIFHYEQDVSGSNFSALKSSQ